jgi:hypothetical protein
MFLGAVVGAELIVHGQIVYPLAIALLAVVGVSGTTRALGASDLAWVHGDG